jgi:hypothetical protein
MVAACGEAGTRGSGEATAWLLSREGVGAGALSACAAAEGAAALSREATSPLPGFPASPPGRGVGRFRKIAGATAIAIISSIAQMVRRSMTQFTGSRNGIKATGMKWVAASQPSDCQPASAKGTVAADRLERILGTGGGKPAARREQRGHEDLVPTDESCHHLTRYRNRRHCSSSGEHSVTPGEKLRPQHIEACKVGLTPGPNYQIVARLPRLQTPTPYLPQPASQTIAGHRR